MDANNPSSDIMVINEQEVWLLSKGHCACKTVGVLHNRENKYQHFEVKHDRANGKEGGVEREGWMLQWQMFDIHLQQC